jgi:putative spermidine/putrescine transport system permease protein
MSDGLALSTGSTLQSGRPSAEAYRATKRRESWRALALALPLLIFLIGTFVVPIAALLLRSVESPEMQAVMPQFARAIERWGGDGLPDETVLRAFVEDLRQASANGTISQVGRRLNYYEAGFRSLLLKTARGLPANEPEFWQPTLVGIDKRWGDTNTWRLVKRGVSAITSDYLLAAVDARIGPDGHLHRVESDQRIYLNALGRTFWISASVTLICLVLGYPVAYLLATLPSRQSNRLMIFVIVPFWTSLLVRTTAWYVLLQPSGVVNSLLTGIGLVSEPVPLVFNRTGVLIGMTHVLLPFMILANYAVMRGISPIYQRAAISLGAHPAIAFLRIYVPQTLPGIGAGVFLVFVLAIGYYITPALLGGGGDEMISQLIALQMERQLNWGLAGALSAYLVVFTLAFYFAFNGVVGVDRLRLG